MPPTLASAQSASAASSPARDGGTTFGPIALVPDGDGTTGQITTFSPNATPTLNQLAYKGLQFGSAIAPDGSSALIASGSAVKVLTSITATPPDEATISVRHFDQEGGKKLDALASSVAMNTKTAVAAVWEQGIVQLRSTGDGGWEVDKRVKIGGAKSDHTRTERGFIPIPRGKSDHPLQFGAVVISAVPTAKGHYLALAIDRTDDVIQVIGDVGTSHPTLLGRISDPDLGKLGLGNEVFGDGGVAFSPLTSTRAVVATPTGVAVLDLDKPKHPKLFASTGSPVDKGDEPVDVAVAPDGDDVTLAQGNGYGSFDGLLSRHKLHGTGGFEYVGDGGMQAVAYLSNGDLTSYRFEVVNTETRYYFDDYSPAPGGEQEVQLTGDGLANSLSVGPAAFPVHFATDHKVTVTPGEKVSIPLTLANGVGDYDFDLFAGHLPAGLHLHGHHIRGTTTDTGAHKVVVRALSPDGGAAFLHLKIVV